MIPPIPIFNWRLYVISDESLGRGRSHREITRCAIEGGADVIQLRDKTTSALKMYHTALQLRQQTRQAGVSFIINDRLDIMQACDADGIHVGQQDLPAPIVRKIIGPGKILGVSAGTLAEAIQAERDGADYLGVGPVFEARASKADAGEPRGLRLIARIRQHCRLPIIAIGGITASNAESVRKAGANAVAVISAIVAAEDIEKAARELKSAVISAGKESG